MNNLWILALCLIILSQDTALAGGAVAATKQRQKMMAKQQQMIIQQQIQQQQQEKLQAQNPLATGSESKVEDVVDITELWKRFETSSEAWALIIDPEAKIVTVAHYIEVFVKNGIKIHKSVEYYAQMIDSLAQQSPDLLKNPFNRVLTMVAILEYNYGNGRNPGETALQFLGKERYLENRRRLGLSK